MVFRGTAAKMGAEVYVRDRTRAGLQSVQRGMTGTMSSISREAGVLSGAAGAAIGGNAMFAAAAAGTAFLGFAGSAVMAFADVEKRWAEVTTLMPGRNKEALAAMEAEVRRFARDTGTTLQDAYAATYQAVSAGIDPENAVGFLRVAERAALAGVTDVTTAVDILTSALNSYGLETEKAVDVSDALFTAVRLGKTTFPELAGSLSQVMPLAAEMNTEFTELTAATAALTARGTPTAEAITQIRAALVALAKDTQARGLFEAATGVSYQQWQEQGGTIQEALSIIVKEARQAGVDVTTAFGRQEGALAALALAAESSAQVFAEAMNVQIGAAEDAAEVLEDTVDFQVRKMTTAWQEYKTWFGQDFVEMMGAAYGNFNDLLATFGVGMTMEEKEILEQSERNWKNYARNQQVIFDRVAEGRRNILARELAGGFQPGPIPGVPTTAPAPPQTGPGSVGEWLWGVSGFGAGGGDTGSLMRMNERAANVFLRNLNDLAGYGVYQRGGGGGGGNQDLRDNTEALNALREQLEEEMERNRQLEVAPGEVPVLPEFLQASELRYISRLVQNKLVGGVVS